MINICETVWIALDDVCNHFGTNANDYIFTHIPREDNTYVPFCFDDDTYIDLMNTMSLDPDNKALSNEFDLMTYLRENIPNRNSCLIYVSF